MNMENKLTKEERLILNVKIQILEKVLYDFENSYTWDFRERLKDSIRRLKELGEK